MNHRNFERILRLLATSSTSVSGTVPKNLNHSILSMCLYDRRGWEGEGLEREGAAGRPGGPSAYCARGANNHVKCAKVICMHCDQIHCALCASRHGQLSQVSFNLYVLHDFCSVLLTVPGFPKSLVSTRLGLCKRRSCHLLFALENIGDSLIVIKAKLF